MNPPLKVLTDQQNAEIVRMLAWFRNTRGAGLSNTPAGATIAPAGTFRPGPNPPPWMHIKITDGVAPDGSYGSGFATSLPVLARYNGIIWNLPLTDPGARDTDLTWSELGTSTRDIYTPDCEVWALGEMSSANSPFGLSYGELVLARFLQFRQNDDGSTTPIFEFYSRSRSLIAVGVAKDGGSDWDASNPSVPASYTYTIANNTANPAFTNQPLSASRPIAAPTTPATAGIWNLDLRTLVWADEQFDMASWLNQATAFTTLQSQVTGLITQVALLTNAAINAGWTVPPYP